MLAMDVWCFSKSTARIDLEKHQTRLHYWGISLCNFGESPLQFWVFLLYTKQHTIIGLEEELVRWRQALIKYLPPEWADGLRSDILNNISRDFEGDPAYDLYVSMVCNGIDPQQEKEKLARMRRLVNGTDETSITYL